AAGDLELGGEVGYEMLTFHGCGHGGGLEDAAVKETDVVADARQVLEMARGKVVEHRHLVATRHEIFHHMGADEAGSSGHQDSLRLQCAVSGTSSAWTK